MAPRIAIIYVSVLIVKKNGKRCQLAHWLTSFPHQYSMYGHIKQLAMSEKAGIEAAGGTCDVYQSVNSTNTHIHIKST